VSGLDIEEILLSGARFKLGPLNLPRLNALDISDTKDRCILILNSLKDSPIARLDLSRTSIVNLWSIQNFSETLRQLVLSFTPVRNVSLLSKCRLLETLNLSHTKVQDRWGMHKVVKHLLSLKKIYLEGTPLQSFASSFLDTSDRARRSRQEVNAQAGGGHAGNGGNPAEQQGDQENEVQVEEENNEDDDDAGQEHENNPEEEEVDLIAVADNAFIDIGINLY